MRHPERAEDMSGDELLVGLAAELRDQLAGEPGVRVRVENCVPGWNARSLGAEALMTSYQGIRGSEEGNRMPDDMFRSWSGRQARPARREMEPAPVPQVMPIGPSRFSDLMPGSLMSVGFCASSRTASPVTDFVTTRPQKASWPSPASVREVPTGPGKPRGAHARTGLGRVQRCDGGPPSAGRRVIRAGER